MKISVNGMIIDTQDIYAIMPIRKLGDSFNSVFEIKFFNRKSLELHSGVSYEEYQQLRDTIQKSSLLEQAMKEASIQAYNIGVERLNILRDNIISYWNEDKSSIPQLNIENITISKKGVMYDND